MIENAERDVAEIGIRLLDDAYLAWLTAESVCERSLHAWFKATGASRATAYCAYRAALDLEDAAARDLQRLWELAQPCRTWIVKPEACTNDH
ncbi:MAG: hypothetical protein JOZ73_07480 [Solirubrobacterales bacterium]|nr:hypothetical protein [Solirubrobacterales bacterium]